ncbi:hypothetical protein RN001_007165 [Aquatica leii]|uniref:DUF1279 domain-containing protein n=1 Tax=Aquatica leii TaxID=1421715 RepID=A0AAN7PW20_9COLE|nr:hypothetical protein RN001_007165 [Aquatica leii]
MALCIRQLCPKNYSLIWQLNRLETFSRITPVLTTIGIQKYNFARCYSEKIRVDSNLNNIEKRNGAKPSLLQRFKSMYRDYWYVLVPVHLVTSIAWFGGFYYLAKSGVDIVGILESWNVSHKITNSLKDSSMGYIAVAYALYKIATPIRYTITLGGTTISINYLKRWGYIKPVPTKDKLKEMYTERKNNLIESLKETHGFYKEKKQDFVKDHKNKLKFKKELLKNQKDSLVEDLEKSLKQIKNVNSNITTNKPSINLNKKQK